MIRDLMTVHNAFYDACANKKLTGSAVVIPVVFFNDQPKLKGKPNYPGIVFQAFVPKPGSKVWVEPTQEFDAENKSVTIDQAPEQLIFTYQVTFEADRFDHANELFLIASKICQQADAQRYITIDGDTFDVEITDTIDMPQLEGGVFQWIFTYRLAIPIYLVDPVVKTAIKQATISVQTM
jgi:hypothetical protein